MARPVSQTSWCLCFSHRSGRDPVAIEFGIWGLLSPWAMIGMSEGNFTDSLPPLIEVLCRLGQRTKRVDLWSSRLICNHTRGSTKRINNQPTKRSSVKKKVFSKTSLCLLPNLRKSEQIPDQITCSAQDLFFLLIDNLCLIDIVSQDRLNHEYRTVYLTV